jgi:hypothetical protein
MDNWKPNMGPWDPDAILPDDAVASADLKVGDRFESIVRGEVFRQFTVLKAVTDPSNKIAGVVEIIRGPYFDEKYDFDERDKGLFSLFHRTREQTLEEYQNYGCYYRLID